MRRRHLLKAEEKEEVLRTIRTVLAGFDEIEVGYVFGSFSQGDFGDVDVAILVAGEPTPYQAMRFRARVERELERGFGYRFEADVKILNTAPVSFQYEVIKSGRRVFSRDNERRVRYEAGVLSLYLDYAETLDWFDRVLLTRV
ncbi:MAG: nucleotidyltransferase domain-containing protein [Methanoculleus bourgensis]|jgi:predicted nucleotidyltransferase|nr:nucleotidyltransferase domain-containing protein [Methanoculleus bourgensis]NMA89106.1 nucleotidyltransferase domain-containing protein [Methanoculleus bourgensis]NQS79340.1 nucleotidyltransferase domain-containing protein [Methanoculleus bourgensis]